MTKIACVYYVYFYKKHLQYSQEKLHIIHSSIIITLILTLSFLYFFIYKSLCGLSGVSMKPLSYCNWGKFRPYVLEVRLLF